MRIVVAIAVLSTALVAQIAHAEDKPAPAQSEPANVTVNLGALPAPMPRRKPSPEQMRALVGPPMPRHKPTADELVRLVPMPRPKPQIDVAQVKPPKIKPPPQPGTEAAPAIEEGLTTPQAAADIATALRGAPVAPTKPVDPTAGFSVLTRVRFTTGRSDLGDEAKAVLDTLAARMLANEERVRLAAFSGQPGDTSSGAHRLSLARGLAIRTYLVGKGVASDRVDVLAFGGSSDGVDRVDVLVRTHPHRTG